MSQAAAAPRNIELEAAVARIDADILALKASVEQNARLGVTQFNKTSDRLEKVEKAGALVQKLEAELADPTLYTERRDAVAGLQNELSAAKAEADRLETRWLELEERREAAG